MDRYESQLSGALKFALSEFGINLRSREVISYSDYYPVLNTPEERMFLAYELDRLGKKDGWVSLGHSIYVAKYFVSAKRSLDSLDLNTLSYYEANVVEKAQQEPLVGIVATGLLHDEEKSHESIPKEVILKPGPLDPWEEALMENHVIYGYKRNRLNFPQYPLIALGSLCHHIKFVPSKFRSYPKYKIISEVGDYEVKTEDFRVEVSGANRLFVELLALSDAYDVLTRIGPIQRTYGKSFPIPIADQILSNDINIGLLGSNRESIPVLLHALREISNTAHIEQGAVQVMKMHEKEAGK